MTVIVCISLYQKTVSFQELGASKVLCSQRRQRGSPANVSTLVFWPSSCIRHTPLTARDRRGWKCQVRMVLAHKAGFLMLCTLLETSQVLQSALALPVDSMLRSPASFQRSSTTPGKLPGRGPVLHLCQNNNLLL